MHVDYDETPTELIDSTEYQVGLMLLYEEMLSTTAQQQPYVPSYAFQSY